MSSVLLVIIHYRIIWKLFWKTFLFSLHCIQCLVNWFEESLKDAIYHNLRLLGHAPHTSMCMELIQWQLFAMFSFASDGWGKVKLKREPQFDFTALLQLNRYTNWLTLSISISEINQISAKILQLCTASPNTTICFPCFSLLQKLKKPNTRFPTLSYYHESPCDTILISETEADAF